MAGQQFLDILAMATKGARGPTNVNRHAVDAAGVEWISVKGAPFYPFGGFGSSGDEGILVNRTASIMGGSRFGWNFDDLEDQTLNRWTLVGGAIAADATHGFGVWTFVNTNTTIIFRNAAPVVVVNPRVTPWHIAGRLRIATAPGAGEIKGITLDNNTANGSMRVGLNGPISTAKFVFAVVDQAGVAVSVLSTISLDISNFHVGEMWSDGTNVYGSVDNETPVLVCPATGCCNNAVMERTGVILAAGAALGLYVDYVYAAAARTAT